MTTVKVPDVPRPKGTDWCWVQNVTIPHNIMARCTKPQGHDGPHSWGEQHTELVERIKKAVEPSAAYGMPTLLIQLLRDALAALRGPAEGA